MIRTIILDFDGVVLESVSIKTQAFRKLFSFTPEYVDAIVQYHLKEMGRSRFEKFEYIYTNFLKKTLTAEEKDRLSTDFSKIVFEEIMAAPYVNGAEEFLIKYHEKIPIYVVSATPEQELVEIIRQRKMSHFFRKVYGSPRSKPESIRSIILENNLPQGSVLFIGDAINDLNSARKCGIRFIGRTVPGEENIFSEFPDVELTLPDLFALSRVLEGGDC